MPTAPGMSAEARARSSSWTSSRVVSQVASVFGKNAAPDTDRSAPSAWWRRTISSGRARLAPWNDPGSSRAQMDAKLRFLRAAEHLVDAVQTAPRCVYRIRSSWSSGFRRHPRAGSNTRDREHRVGCPRLLHEQRVRRPLDRRLRHRLSCPARRSRAVGLTIRRHQRRRRDAIGGVRISETVEAASEPDQRRYRASNRDHPSVLVRPCREAPPACRPAASSPYIVPATGAT